MLILASQSPRRSELLSQAGIPFTVCPPSIHEEREPGESAENYVVRLARDKACAINASGGHFVLAADTVVVVGEQVLEKPSSPEDAARMLRLLSGRAHTVTTGICLRHGSRLDTAVESTLVRFTVLSEKEIQDYVASGEPMDKAGAYAIQGLASKFITGIEGCYFNVVGLPVARVYSMLRNAGYGFTRR